MKLTFVKLVKLVDVEYEGETAETKARWLRNVKNSKVENGYTLADDGDDFIRKEFSADEVEFDEAECYNFMGSAYEDERFYAADWFVVREIATGDLYALETESLYAF